MTTVRALIQTAILACGLALLLLAGLQTIAVAPTAPSALTLGLAAPSSALLALKVAQALRTGVHVTWQATLVRRDRPVAYGLAVAFETVCAVCLLLLVVHAGLTLWT